MEHLEELKRKYEELGKEIERLEGTKRFRADDGEVYWYIDSDGNVEEDCDNRYSEDNFRYECRNYFKTREQGLKALKKLKTYNQLKDLAEKLNKGEKIDWEDSKDKYYIEYEPQDDSLDDNSNISYKKLGNIYCLNDDFLDEAIEVIGEDNLKDLFKED